MKQILKNWKTTSAGVISVITGIVILINDQSQVIQSSTAILAGIGLIFAADTGVKQDA